MSNDVNSAAVSWIDHYVVPTNDILRWNSFMEAILGGKVHQLGGLSTAERLRHAAVRSFQEVSEYHHIGGFLQDRMLPAPVGLGKEYPRYAFFVRNEDIGDHLRRLDKFQVEHSDPVQRSDDGDEGTSIFLQDPDGNQYEFWAPINIPAGAMECVNPVGVGRISHAVLESTDLSRTRAFYARYCGIEAIANDDVPSDTLALRLTGGGRLVFKETAAIGPRTGGHTLWYGIHLALTVSEEDLLPMYRLMWDELPELPLEDYRTSAGTGVRVGEGAARTELHPMQQRGERPNTLGRGTEFYDWDDNNYHFVSGKFALGQLAHYKTGSDPLFN